jgi:hypothetical protein
LEGKKEGRREGGKEERKKRKQKKRRQRKRKGRKRGRRRKTEEFYNLCFLKYYFLVILTYQLPGSSVYHQ